MARRLKRIESKDGKGKFSPRCCVFFFHGGRRDKGEQFKGAFNGRWFKEQWPRETGE